MKLPNGERAIVDSRQLLGYCLNPHHSRGRSTARVYMSVGIGLAEADVLREALLSAHGQRYIVDFDLVSRDRTVSVRSTWILRIGEDFPRLTTCYVL